MYPPFTGGFRRSSMAFGGCGSCFVISDLLVKALILVLPGVKRPLSTWLVLLVSSAFSLSVDTGTWVSQLGLWSLVLGDHKCGDGSRESH